MTAPAQDSPPEEIHPEHAPPSDGRSAEPDGRSDAEQAQENQDRALESGEESPG